MRHMVYRSYTLYSSNRSSSFRWGNWQVNIEKYLKKQNIFLQYLYILYLVPEMNNVSLLLKDLLKRMLKPANERATID